LKLDELIHAISRAENQMMEIDNLTDAKLVVLQVNFEKICAASIKRMERKKWNEKSE
jgi:hypothetical protein